MMQKKIIKEILGKDGKPYASVGSYGVERIVPYTVNDEIRWFQVSGSVDLIKMVNARFVEQIRF